MVETSPSLDPFEQFAVERPEEAARIDRLISEGRSLLEGGRADEARVRFVKALAIFPLIPSALTNLAALALHAGHEDQAWHYLSQVLEHFPCDPSANGVAMRYWLQRGSYPRAYYHGTQAVRGLDMLIKRFDTLRDPSVVDRARIILMSVLPNFAADSLITQLSTVCGDRPWDDVAKTAIGIAWYNTGEFEKAKETWTACSGYDPARLYLFLLELVERGVVVPFRLDYQLNAALPSVADVHTSLQLMLPRSGQPLRVVRNGKDEIKEDETPPLKEDDERAFMEAVRYAMMRPLPSLAAVEGMYDIFHGTDAEAEAALSILFFHRWPYLPQLLPAIVADTGLTLRVRLNGALYILWTLGPEEAQKALDALSSDQKSPIEELLAGIIRMQIAWVTEDVAAGRAAEARARQAAARVDGDDIEMWLAILEELSRRFSDLEGAAKRDSTGVSPVQPVTGTSNIIPFPARRDKGRSGE